MAESAHGRLTFRNAVHDVAWQRQLRDRFAREGLPPGLKPEMLDLKKATVRQVSRAVAEQIILKYEWLGTMAATGVHFGLFFGPYCAGVTCVAVGSGSGGTNVHKPFGVDRHALAILARGACVHWAPVGSNSKLVSWTTRLAPKVDPRLKVMIAYADTDAGEVGTIYQACNWTYIGRGSATRQWVAPNGRVMDQKLPSNIAHSLQAKPIAGYDSVERRDVVTALRANGWREQESNPKHRYVAVLDKSDKALVARVEAMRCEYPKRESARPGSIESDAGTFQVSQGSASLTPGLQPVSADLPPDPLA